MSRSDMLNIGVGALFTALGFLFGGPILGCCLLFVGVVFVVRASLGERENQTGLELSMPALSEKNTKGTQPPPDLIFATFSVDLISALQKNAFLLHVRNDAISPLAAARDVVAHIGYKRQNGDGMQVDCGAWMENAVTINIDRGQTKRLIVALTDDGKNCAVNFTGPRTDFKAPELVPVRELTAGQWMMIVRINAEDYRKTGYFLLTVEQNGAIGCKQIKQPLW